MLLRTLSSHGTRPVYLPASVSSSSKPGTCDPVNNIVELLDRLQHLLRKNADAIAGSIVLEQGKTLAGATTSDSTMPVHAVDIIAQTLTVIYFGVSRSSRLPSQQRPHFWVTSLKVCMLHSCACGNAEITPVSKDMDTYVRKVPLGVCASIAPFNFPA